MGACISSTGSEEQTKKEAKPLIERKEEAKEIRRTRSFMSNLVHEEFGKKIEEDYQFDETVELGEGAYAVVKLGVKKATGKKYAVKVFKLRGDLRVDQLELLMKEVDIMRKLDHPSIIRLQEVYQEENMLYLVMDLATGGDLQSKYAANQSFFANEDNASTLIKKVVMAVRYCHSRGIVHRDIKLENLMLDSDKADAELKLMDFGLSTIVDASRTDPEDYSCGTVDYMAPEQIKGKAVMASDLWSIGVVAYVMLVGYFPFYAANSDGVRLKIRWGGFSFAKEDTAHMSEESKDFIRRLMVKDPYKRMTAAEALAHPWLERARKNVGPVTDTVVGQMLKFEDKKGISRIALEIVAHNLEAEQLSVLAKEFQKFDEDGSGVIELQEFVKVMGQQGMSEADSTRVFQQIDLNSSGTVQFNEFLAAAMNRQHVTEKAVREAFNHLDVNKKGVITIDDLKNITGTDMDEDNLKAALLEIDESGKGEVSYEAFSMAMRQSISFIMTPNDSSGALSSQQHDGSNGAATAGGGGGGGGPYRRSSFNARPPSSTAIDGGVGLGLGLPLGLDDVITESKMASDEEEEEEEDNEGGEDIFGASPPESPKPNPTTGSLPPPLPSAVPVVVVQQPHQQQQLQKEQQQSPPGGSKVYTLASIHSLAALSLRTEEEPALPLAVQ